MCFEDAVKKGLACPYCGKVTELKKAESFFINKPNAKGFVRVCEDCNAFAVCNSGDYTSIFSLSNDKTRKLRTLASTLYKCLINKKLKLNKNMDLKTANHLILKWQAKELKTSYSNLIVKTASDYYLEKLIDLMSKYVTNEEIINYDKHSASNTLPH